MRLTEGIAAIGPIDRGERMRIKDNVACECNDPGCNGHLRASVCRENATEILYRVDMEDASGTAMCNLCAIDAFESGVFTDSAPLASWAKRS